MRYVRVPKGGNPSYVQQRFYEPRLQVLCCHYWWLSAWRHPRLMFPYWRVYWNDRPGAWVGVGNEAVAVDPEHFLAIPPMTPFWTRLGPADDSPERGGVSFEGGPVEEPPSAEEGAAQPVIRHFFVHFTAGLPYDSFPPRILRFPADPEGRAMLETIVARLRRDPAYFGRYHSLLLTAFLCRLLAQIPEHGWPGRPQDRRLRHVMELMEEHLESRLTNHELAGAANMSTNAFARLFGEQVGQSPQSYWLQRRLQRACILLHHTDKSIDEIAGECGFCDRHYFSRMFKRQEGVGPAAYRKRAAPPQPR